MTEDWPIFPKIKFPRTIYNKNFYFYGKVIFPHMMPENYIESLHSEQRMCFERIYFIQIIFNSKISSICNNFFPFSLFLVEFYRLRNIDLKNTNVHIQSVDIIAGGNTLELPFHVVRSELYKGERCEINNVAINSVTYFAIKLNE